MTKVSPFIWQIWLGDMPMPEDATYEMMEAAKDALRTMERKDEAVEGLNYHTASLEHYDSLLAEARKNGEPTATLESIVATIKEILDTYRSWLAE